MQVVRLLAIMASVLLWLATIAGAVFGAVTFVSGMLTADSSPQQAAVAATAVAFGVIPYVAARALGEMLDVFRIRQIPPKGAEPKP